VNAGNMINDKWGVGTVTTTVNPLQWRSKNANNQPVYRFTEINNALPEKALITGNRLGDVWQIQLGGRYIFN
jgi:hypothetical protein